LASTPTTLPALTRLFAKLGAPDPEAWAESQLTEGIPQLARFLFLRQAWRQILTDGDTSWIDLWITASRQGPDDPYAGVGAALSRLRAAGASDHDLTELVRGLQADLLFALCCQLEDPGELEPEVQHVLWALVQIDEHGEILGQLGGLHESVLETDPTGREMRPGGPSEHTAEGPDAPLFTPDDYQPLADAAYREEDRRRWFREATGCDAHDDDQLERLADLTRRVGIYLQRTGEAGPAAESSRS